MWRWYVINALKVAALGVVALEAWHLAVWIRGGDFGRLSTPGYEQYGFTTDFLGLFAILLLIGIAIVTPLLWGGRKSSSSGDSFPQDMG
jgi:hypothetical protein